MELDERLTAIQTSIDRNTAIDGELHDELIKMGSTTQAMIDSMKEYQQYLQGTVDRLLNSQERTASRILKYLGWVMAAALGLKVTGVI